MKKVGIDIGATAVRVVEVSGVDKEGLAIVTAAGIEPIPVGAVSAGRVEDPAQVAAAVRAACKSARISPYGVILGVSSPRAALARKQMVGGLTPQEWPRVLRLQDSNISPTTPLSESAISLNRISSSTNPLTGVTTDTLLAAATLRSEVENLMTVCRLARVTPRAIDLAAAGAFRGLVRVTAGDRAVSTMVDIGAGKITVATRAGMHLRSVRTTEGGGEDITRALAGLLDVPWAEAEQMKLSARVGSPGPAAATQMAHQIATMYGADDDQVTPEAGPQRVVASESAAEESLTTSTQKMIDRIAGAVEDDRAEHPDSPTEVIQLCGSGALLQGLPEMMQARLGIASFIGRPWLQVNTGSRTSAVFTGGAPDPAKVHSLVIATGLALWQEAH